ncbi:o-succinylbenzoate synthase [Aestuariimicrobium kwangyangense]|uniref:o-succinylbenzoate synthase n=1 Tax=Aestuariimicrobium kwangyangense TaxID=396389 RepID=UPI0003B52D7B|nr:o-succinylbenzoate synthase [Aestuariimicrobium kwangyangense]
MTTTAWLEATATEIHSYGIDLRMRFRGIQRREGLVLRGPAGWGEFSPFLDYSGSELVGWWLACEEACTQGFPAPVRTRVAVNSTVPVIPPDQAQRWVLAQGCRTAKVKVADPRSDLSSDHDRLAAVREALGADGRVRIDANGAWSVDEAVEAITRFRSIGLEYVEQPCATTEELASLRVRLARAGIDVPIAADESIRRSGDPERVVALEAADIAVLKVQPLGGVRRCLELAERLGLPVVVSSALETSLGLRMGIALAAALPELPYDCGLNTSTLLTSDLVDEPLVAVGGAIEVREVSADEVLLGRHAPSQERERWWLERLATTRRLAEAGARGTVGQ